ncbi:MAG: Peptidase M23, partial [Parcubacteria group bacterium GW2011_GWB1_40_14]
MGSVLSFVASNPVSAPTVNTNSPTTINATSATVSGAVNPNGGATTAWFRYSSINPGSCNDAFGTRVLSSGGFSAGSGTSFVSYSNNFTGLVTGTTYYYCAIASNAGGISFGSVLSFVASDPPMLPTVTTNAATSITVDSAILNGTVNPNGAGNSGLGWFRYSTTNPGSCNDSFGTRAPASGGAIGYAGGTTTTPYERTISGLTGGSLYYFCAIANNPYGNGYGSMMQFTTPFSPPTVTTDPPTSVNATSATLNGTVNPNGNTATA